MKSEIELTIDNSGNPVLDIRHWDKSDNLEQKLLGVFLEGASRYGLVIDHQSGFLEVGTDKSWESYRIRVG